MIEVSNAYRELVKSNIRPKCDPIIKISGIDNMGKETTLVWESKNIKELTYKRKIDPIGRELPYMELSWTEIYDGKLNNKKYPEKYQNIVKYMTVDLCFVQEYGFFTSWKTLFDDGDIWSNLCNFTWKSVKNKKPKEYIYMPRMFLSARPVIDGKTIKWVAKDVLSFLDEKLIKAFYGERHTIPFKNPMVYLLQSSRGGFLQSVDMVAMLNSCANNIIDDFDNEDLLEKNIIFDGAIKDCIKNYANLRNFFWDFNGNIPVLKKEYEHTDYLFTNKIMHKEPTITNGTNVSSYSFKSHLLQIDENSPYKKKSSKINLGNKNYNLECDIWYYDGYGTCNLNDVPEEINYAINISESNEPKNLIIYPISYNSYDNILNDLIVGEPFVEDNPINPYGVSSNYMADRFQLLKKYFNENSSVLEFETLSNLSVETGDVISISTNLFDESEGQIIKNAVVVEFEITYNGALKEKIIAHEVNLL